MRNPIVTGQFYSREAKTKLKELDLKAIKMIEKIDLGDFLDSD